MKSNGKETSTFSACLDTGNNMAHPAMSSVTYRKLNIQGVINSKQRLQSTNSVASSVNKMAVIIKGMLNFDTPLHFYTEMQRVLSLKTFYIIDNMSNDINIGKYTMSGLNIKWFLKDDCILIGNDKIPLRPPLQENAIHIITQINARKKLPMPIIPGLHQRNATRLYLSQTTTLPPITIKNITVQPRKELKPLLRWDRDVLIIANKDFQKKQAVINNPITIANRNNQITAVFIPYDSNVIIKKVN